MASGSKMKFSNKGPSVVHHHHNNSNDFGSETGSVEFSTYTVQIPLTPDNQPMEISMERSTSQRVEDQYASSSLFTGGYNCVTRAHLKEKVIESDAGRSSHPQMTGLKGSPCSVPGCDSRCLTDERGLDIVPCDCDFKICRDCYRDAIKTGDGVCPGCKEPYKEAEFNEYQQPHQPLPLPPAMAAAAAGAGMSKMERRLSMMKSKSMSVSKSMTRSQSGEFDHTKWLFETKGSYGYGNAMWPKDGESGSEDGIAGDPKVFLEKQWKPLTRKLNISAAILSPYRYIYSSFPLISFGCYCFCVT